MKNYIYISKFFLLIVSLVLTSTMFGQIRDLDNFGNPIQTDNLDTVFNPSDTIINKNGFLSIFTGKPGKATLYGLLIPSGGQIYNRKWWKVPIALGIDGGAAYWVVYTRKTYIDTRDLYQEILNTDGHPFAGSSERVRQKRNEFRKMSEMSWVWLAIAHIFTVMDAYVDRHMMEFDISPDLSIYNHSFDGGIEWAAQMKITIPISKLYTYNKPKSPNPLLLSYQ